MSQDCPLCSVSKDAINIIKGEEKEFANLKCPYCGYVQKVEIPKQKCLSFYKCQKCGKMITVPKDSDECCVICLYSDKKCPVGANK